MDRADIVHDAFVRRVKEENYQQEHGDWRDLG